MENKYLSLKANEDFLSANLPLLAAGWVNLESHCCRDETVILLVEDVIHFERASVLDVSVAAQFDSIDLFAECECGVLEADARSELAIEQSNLGSVLRCWQLNYCENLIGEKKY